MRKVVATIFVLAVLGSATALAVPVGTGYVDSAGRDWLPTPNPDLSWSQLAAICDPITGYCNQGFLGTGVYWASLTDVRNVIDATSGIPAGSFTTDFASFPTQAGYADSVFSTLGVTFANSSSFILDGLTRSLMTGTSGTSATEVQVVSQRFMGEPIPGGQDSFRVIYPTPNFETDEVGAYFYKVPEPGIFAVFAGGLLILGLAHRRRSSRHGRHQKASSQAGQYG